MKQKPSTEWAGDAARKPVKGNEWFATFTFMDVSGAIGSSFFRSIRSNGTVQREIFLLGAEDTDTEEYDRHVIAHEWGHYLEDAFSRSDSVGGPHALGDQLDMRVAFGEGWGNAFSAMVERDPVYKDTLGPAQNTGFYLDVESEIVPNC